jgi:membrane protein implicated in regulation of membrane protease activity
MNAWLFPFTWYNLPFTFLLGVCLVLAVLQLIGLGGQHEGGTDLEHGVEVEHDVSLEHDMAFEHEVALEHEVTLEHEVDLGHAVGHDAGDLDHTVEHDVSHDAGHAVDHGGGFSFLSALAFLGVGKAPLLVVLLILFGSIGILGWLLNAVIVSLLGGNYPGLAFGGVLVVVLALGVTVSSRTAQLIARALPPFFSTASRADTFIGRTGDVISPTVDDKYGQVHLRDPGGTLITVFAVTRTESPIPRGTEVVVVAYDAQQRCYLVTRSKPGYPTLPNSN